MGKINRFTIFVLCFLFFIFCSLIYIGQGIYLPESSSALEQVFSIEKGESVREIAYNLESQSLIKNDMFFILYIFLSGDTKKLQAGEYLISSSQTIPKITRKFVKGETIKEKITIIEGWSLRNIGFYFENRRMFQAEEVWEMVGFPMADYSKTIDLPWPKDFSDDFNFLRDKPKNLGLEGYLFPDTYEIRKNESLENIVKKMLSNFDGKLTSDLREEIKRQQKSIFEIVIMASILEKEVRTIEDKKIVSGIFWKKINNGEPLYSCATIAYILGREDWTFDEMREEIASGKDIDSPYNTYIYPGFPLGPISNPGLESIMAAIYPEETDYRYYLSTPEGETHFSETLEEHNIKKEKYFK